MRQKKRGRYINILISKCARKHQQSKEYDVDMKLEKNGTDQRFQKKNPSVYSQLNCEELRWGKKNLISKSYWQN